MASQYESLIIKNMKTDIKNYAESLAAEAEKLLKELVVIPAPCKKEQRKAAYCKEWLESRGALDVYVDEAGNVVYPYEIQHRDRLVVVMAHIDIPFSEEDKLIVTQKGRILEGPGTGDTGNLVALLLTAGYFASRQPKLGQGILFVATTGATGIGDLYGARQIMKDYEGRIGTVISLQGYLGQCIHRFPGVLRCEVQAKRKWKEASAHRAGSVYGESAAGNPILLMAQLAGELSEVSATAMERELAELSDKPEGLLQVSQIQGGSSPDTLAEQAKLVYELSSLSSEWMEQMKLRTMACVGKLEGEGVEISIRTLADRPCESRSLAESKAQQTLVNYAIDAMQAYNMIALLVADSEVNLARTAGIPGICVGTILGSRPGSQWEQVEINSQRAGVGVVLNLLIDVCADSTKEAHSVFPMSPNVGAMGTAMVLHWNGLVMQGDTLLQVLDRHRSELTLPSFIHKIDPSALRGMEHLVLRILSPEQIMDLKPVLQGKQLRLELGCQEDTRIVLPFTSIGGYDQVFREEGPEGIRYEAYDARFSRIQDKNLQLEIAISRYLYPVGLTESYRAQYEQHLKKRFRPAMLELMSGRWHRYGRPPKRLVALMGLKKMDRFLQQELIGCASGAGILWEIHGAEEHALIVSHVQPGLLPICKLLEEAGRLPRGNSIPLRAYAHGLFHYIYGHPWWPVDGTLWNLACDIAVNYLTDQQLGPEWLVQAGEPCSEYLERKTVYDSLLLRQPVLTAEQVYEALQQLFVITENQNTELLAAWTRLMKVDDHNIWPVASADTVMNNKVDWSMNPQEAKLKSELEEALKSLLQGGAGMGRKQHQLQGQAGTKAGAKEEEAHLNKREGQDYQTFLQQFMVCKEDRILDLDSFDPVYYTYGLTHYEDMPFVEPLETKEVNRLEELVIVIDTSGSCQGELVRFFLEETWSVFGHAENFFDQFHVRILQCDCVVQEDVKLTNLREVEEYMKQLVIRGGGGTDFRPAFRHIRELKRSGELGHLKGILYFTDGQGVYPEQVPDCETAFIFLEGRYEMLKVPYWAKTLILQLPKDGSLKLEYSGEFRI